MPQDLQRYADQYFVDVGRTVVSVSNGAALAGLDALPMLERRLKKRVDIEKTPEVQGELFKYLSENFVFQNKKGEVQKLKWVGREFENDVVYVYVEIPFAETFEGARLQNTIFFESFAEQTNLVVARFGDKKVDLLFKAGEGLKDL